MIGKLLTADFLKIKRKGLWFLTLLGPLGVVALQMVNYGVRKDYLLQQSEDDWGYYLLNIHSFTPLAIVLGIAILTSFMASIENETNAWKQLIALPVSKLSVYLSKFTVLALLLFLASTVLMIFTLSYGLFLNLGAPVPYLEVAKFSYFPALAALPILALQLWIASVSHNQGIPITVGIFGVIFAYSSFVLPDWMIWKWPSLMNQWDEPIINVLLGVGIGILLYIVGMIDFARRDVK
ncbi:ABC transporter permease [Lysinibacillus irui]|uniref:ABC transporter permease n=1 Tax=Lysinibacillus irui TaxID=2998077 RepID=A0AAJ5UVE7_9BACI|nr:ABC transporter permease [Lysinibacillus irui]MEA0552516.1 ABC transporter permease [Lysinibacillus irui]MEA0562894.1 ABC transporter permease [Lysinibacillus irui]MEA0978468.1 ABC transporter permease [Lysinibacillus irui]MEA1044622.1 ABC transporter permease [Lysinibacillus irui]WDV06655.1 ABC transporter permease [Lysinibacillus irui]